ncbi:hypothetical protein FHR83_007117 [Actinoplanes campanulatus]|uniref:Uncharacterized protein n=1 Tax=Actinoplanes campanulatus TaxID=113559 RepID=A0A7W5ANJ6_9ACTN|nr:hypothetical protein [Actinoplanes campanulatus]MBB3099411.1 hypothetical protein [Actinoplanes campanulatus]GGN40106.1 hypothetical protein GCM10010109_68750 [Actinoplanes campanulatus]GID42380.1 hypothetical protein Aca09nite_88860 [Actinoplanes campanulatus]
MATIIVCDVCFSAGKSVTDFEISDGTRTVPIVLCDEHAEPFRKALETGGKRAPASKPAAPAFSSPEPEQPIVKRAPAKASKAASRPASPRKRTSRAMTMEEIEQGKQDGTL